MTTETDPSEEWQRWGTNASSEEFEAMLTRLIVATGGAKRAAMEWVFSPHPEQLEAAKQTYVEYGLGTSEAPKHILRLLALPDMSAGAAQLEGEVEFPRKTLVVARVDAGPAFYLDLAVAEGQAVIQQFLMTKLDKTGIKGPNITDLPLETIFNKAISATAQQFLISSRLAQKKVPSFEYVDYAGRVVVAGRRGRPVSDEDLRRTAEIVRANPYDPRTDIAEELHISKRTASRWIAKTREAKTRKRLGLDDGGQK